MDKLSQLDRYIRSAMEQWSVPGLAIAVVKGDSTLFARGYGVREVGTRDSVNSSTIFGLLSPTKTFTTTALAMLVEEGRLSWDAPVARYLPNFRLSDSVRTKELTIRDLISHRSGYADPVQLWYESGLSREEIVDQLDTVEPDVPPRSEFLYNNAMYVVADEVIEAVSGMSWEDFVQKRILDPLGMDRSTVTPSALAGRSSVASPHVRSLFGTFGAVRPSEIIRFENIAPAGAMQTSVEDMAAWLKVHLEEGKYGDRRLLKQTSVRDLQEPRVAVPDKEFGPLSRVVDSIAYGSGWFVLNYRGRKIAVHGGGHPANARTSASCRAKISVWSCSPTWMKRRFRRCSRITFSTCLRKRSRWIGARFFTKRPLLGGSFGDALKKVNARYNPVLHADLECDSSARCSAVGVSVTSINRQYHPGLVSTKTLAVNQINTSACQMSKKGILLTHEEV